MTVVEMGSHEGQPVTQAIILAAGRGARFRPVTDTLPKPLVQIGGKALIEWQIEALLAQGVKRILINCCYLADQLIAHVVAQGYDGDIIFSHEETALETGGGIKRALPHFEGRLFYAVNSDVVLWPTSGNYLAQLRRAFTLRPELKLALLLHPTLGAIGLNGAGDFFCHTDGMLWRRGMQKTAPYFFTGLQLMHPSVFDRMEQTIFSMNHVYNQLLAEMPEAMAGIVNPAGYMLHVGDAQGHAACEAFLQKHSVASVTAL